MTEHHKTTEERLAELEAYVKDELWVTNRSFLKRTFSIYGHQVLASLIIGAACCLVFGLLAVFGIVLSGALS